MLHVIDRLWIQHLTAIDDLREGIGLRAYGQRDPLVEYKVEAATMFEELLETIRHDVVYTIYHVAPATEQPSERAAADDSPIARSEGLASSRCRLAKRSAATTLPLREWTRSSRGATGAERGEMDRRPSDVLQAVLENVEKVIVGKRSRTRAARSSRWPARATC